MPIFQIKNKKLSPLKEKRFDLESDIQKLAEENLGEIFGLEFVASEFHLGNFWIDTLAFDQENKSFVVIEYKRDQSYSVVDQGLHYLRLVLDNLPACILAYNEGKNGNLKTTDVDRSQSRILFIAKSFTPYQASAISFRDLPIELWEVSLFEDDLILFNQLKPPETRETLAGISKGRAIAKVSAEIKRYSLDDHLKNTTPATKDLFFELREKIMAISDEVTERPVKFYIGYKSRPYNFANIHVRKFKLTIDIRINKPNDPRKVLKMLPEEWGYGTTKLWRFDIENPNKIFYAVDLIRQAYEATL